MEASAHSEVAQQGVPSREIGNDELGAPPDGHHFGADRRSFDLLARDRSSEAKGLARHLDPNDTAAGQAYGQVTHDGFDFGKLRHQVSFPSARTAASVTRWIRASMQVLVGRRAQMLSVNATPGQPVDAGSPVRLAAMNRLLARLLYLSASLLGRLPWPVLLRLGDALAAWWRWRDVRESRVARINLELA